jgi:hypothetical protein
VTPAFGGQYSIQLSYGRIEAVCRWHNDTSYFVRGETSTEELWRIYRRLVRHLVAAAMIPDKLMLATLSSPCPSATRHFRYNARLWASEAMPT